MRRFKHINASSLEEAAMLLGDSKGRARLLAGGTVVLGELKNDIFAEYPDLIVNIKSIKNLNYIREDGDTLKIGALVKIGDIASSQMVKERCGILADAARSVGSPQIREMGTIGGNICQSPRCWYYWNPNNRFNCIRKGGASCYALTGENHHSSIFGALRVGDPPCMSNCPGGTDIPLYMSKLREGDLYQASRLLLQYNPIPAVTGRVCASYCGQHCNRGDFDQPISIKLIERFLGDYILENAANIIDPIATSTGKSVAIVGSGPAGLTAAYYLRLLGYSVDVFDRMEEAGGVLRYGIPPYRLPKDVVRKQIWFFEQMGIQFKLNVEVGKHVTLDNLRKKYDSVFLGCGTWSHRRIGIEGEELAEPALHFLNSVNSENRKRLADKVLVIGGGNVAIDAAVTALRFGAEQVTLVCLENRKEMPASPQEVEQAEEEGVRVMPSLGPVRLLTEGRMVLGVEFVRCLSVYDAGGNFSPSFDNSTRETVLASEVILATGQKSDLSFLDPQVRLETQRDLVVIDRDTLQTSVSGIFAGGDITTGPLSVIEASVAGRNAARSIDQYLCGTEGLPVQPRRKYTDMQPRLFNVNSFQKNDRLAEPQRAEIIKRIDNEDISGLHHEGWLQEANRCFNCGCVAVNVSDIAPALIVLNATIKTNKRLVDAETLFCVGSTKSTILDDDEIVTEVQVPLPGINTRGTFMKFALRKSIDFPIVNCAVALHSDKGIVKSVRICLNGVFCTPLRGRKAETMLVGKMIDELSASEAASAAIQDAVPLPNNSYKVQIARVLLKRAILSCRVGE